LNKVIIIIDLARMGELKRHKAQVRDKRHKGTETQREIQSGAARLSTRSTKSTKSTEALKKAAVKLAGGLGIQGELRRVKFEE
jgi:hypothetical protein